MSDSDHPSDGATGTEPPIQHPSQFDAFEQFEGCVDSRCHELKEKVKFKDYKTTLDLFQYGGYARSFHLKSGYHHVGIFPSHQRFLGFSWTFPHGRTRYFAYTILPSGLSSAPYLFTKLMRPLVKYWGS